MSTAFTAFKPLENSHRITAPRSSNTFLAGGAQAGYLQARSRSTSRPRQTCSPAPGRSAFPYDDVNDQSSVQILGNSNPPTDLTLGIGW